MAARFLSGTSAAGEAETNLGVGRGPGHWHLAHEGAAFCGELVCFHGDRTEREDFQCPTLEGDDDIIMHARRGDAVLSQPGEVEIEYRH